MTVLYANTLDYRLTPSGRLLDLGQWNEDVACSLAQKEGISLTPEHWEVLSVMRLFYQEYNVSPSRKLLRKALGDRLGPEKATDEHLDALFPDDVQIQGTRIAGIPEPLLDAELEPAHYTTGKLPDTGARHFMEEFEFEERTYRVYPRGNLVDPGDWSERVGKFLAEKEGLELTPEHWEVIRFLRGFYFQYGITPMVKLLVKHMQDQEGDQRINEAYLYELFPEGPSRQGSRIAGLPEPQGCIDP